MTAISLIMIKINLLYIGTIPVHIRNPEYFLKLFCELPGDDIALNIIGSCTAPIYFTAFPKVIKESI